MIALLLLDVAARLVGFDDAIEARVGDNFNVVGTLFHGRLDPLLAAGLTKDERARLLAEGAAMRDEEAFRLAIDGTSWQAA